MMDILQPDQRLHANLSQFTCQVHGLLGSGTQGEVYRVEAGGEMLALKWYKREYAETDDLLRQRLEQAIRLGSPSDRFLWPVDIVTSDAVPAFGYLMPLLPVEFRGLTDVVTRLVEPSFRALATAGFQLADSFLALHAKGLCYRDISFGNLFINPTSGDVLIVDNDNVDVDGRTSAILGTLGFIAPEVIRGEAAPSSRTDLFSLANLLFQMLLLTHPLEGKLESQIHCYNPVAKRKIHGLKPLFIFDPNDESNRPDPQIHDNAETYWQLYPRFLKELFMQSFTVGLRDPDGRVAESMWRSAMIRLRDAIVYCGACEVESFVDPDAPAEHPLVCWACDRRIQTPYRLRIGRSFVMLNHDTKLFPHHLDPGRSYDFSSPVADLRAHPTRPDVFGLRNLTGRTWTATTPRGDLARVEPGRSIQLEPGTRVHFGGQEGEILR